MGGRGIESPLPWGIAPDPRTFFSKPRDTPVIVTQPRRRATSASTSHTLAASDPRAGLEREWLLPDGLGGYCMGTAAGANTRRYHALLVSAMTAPTGRVLALSNTVDTIIAADGGRTELSTFRFGDDVVHPDGRARLESFERSDPMAEDAAEVRWRWSFGGARVTKSVRPLWRRGGVRIEYRASGLSPGAALDVRPLVALRDFHALLRRPAEFDTRVLRAKASKGAPAHLAVTRDGFTLHLLRDAGEFVREPDWWTNFRYDRERERQYDCDEDLFTPGRLVVPADERGEARLTIIGVVARVGATIDDGAALFGASDERPAHLRRLAKHAGEGDGAIALLAQAADDFVVPRTVDGKELSTIIAGYPWFADWGRDAMISLPGILLTTGRFDEARALLEAFAGLRRRGMLPNCFTDGESAPHYNTVDASMWFLHAVGELGRHTKVGDALLEAALDIIERYAHGTDFDIRVDPSDGLVMAGDASTQLTWMDARRDGVVFTPRNGKCVEINALWVSGLRAIAELLTKGRTREAETLRHRADLASESLRLLFWRPQLGCYCDRLAPDGRGGWNPIGEVRPNQLFAAALERTGIPIEHRRAIVAKAKETLLTPGGMRTLAPGSNGYQARYEGSMFERDRAYHNGTAWPWLLGAFVEATLRAGEFSASSKREAREAIAPLIGAVVDGTSLCLGQVAEIFDAEGSPQRADGCPAQAWSVAELLRALTLLKA